VIFAAEASLQVRASQSYVHYIILSPISTYGWSVPLDVEAATAV
jgi:hypothetical protein